MAKKNKDKGETSSPKGRGKAARTPMEFLSISFENADRETVKRHLMYLIAASLLTKFLVIILTPAVFHSFIDYFDLQLYYGYAVNILDGQLPYLGYNFDYPVLIMVPILIALVPAVLFQSGAFFFFTFQALMVICDIVTLLCVYFIALKLSGSRTAFISGLLCATAFSTAYFVLTKYDAFPTCLLMLAVFFTLCGMSLRGYIAAGLGFFAKIFPAIAFPFFVLHNMKKSSLKDEIVSVLKVMVPLSVVLLLPAVIIRPDAIRAYLFATGSGVGVYVNTLTYTVFAWLNGVGHLPVSAENISLIMYGLMGLTLLYLLYAAWIDTAKRPVTLLKTLLCAFLAVIVFTKFHSPQYLVWFTPLLCLLVADDIYKIALFYLVQVFAYIEFPLMFGGFYTNTEYMSAAGSPGWYIILVFFTLQYLVLSVLVFLIVRPEGGLQALLKARPQPEQ